MDKPLVVKKQTSVGGHVAELASMLGKAGGIKMDAPVKKRGMCQFYGIYILTSQHRKFGGPVRKIATVCCNICDALNMSSVLEQ